MLQRHVKDHTFSDYVDGFVEYTCNFVEAEHLSSLQGESNVFATPSVTQTPGVNYSHVWRKTTEHFFPMDLPHPPDGHTEVHAMWNGLMAKGSLLLQTYLVSAAFEMDQFDKSSFITLSVGFSLVGKLLGLTDIQPAQDLNRLGLVDGFIALHMDHHTRDPKTLIRALDDTLQVGFVLSCHTSLAHRQRPRGIQ